MSATARFTRADYRVDARTLARRLLGQRLVRTGGDGVRMAGVIVETEAYVGVRDRACHSFGGRRTLRNQTMYADGGTAYVYFTYGMHHCFNVVCSVEGDPVAVLIRALEPTEGLDAMRANRAASLRAAKDTLPDRLLCSGPGRVCQALGLSRADDGVDMAGGGGTGLHIERVRSRALPSRLVAVGPRIGVDGAGPPWAGAALRFWIRAHPGVSAGRREG